MKKILYIFAALLAGVVISCNSKEQTTAGEITLTSNDMERVDVAGGEITISFKSTTAWRASVSAEAKDWIKVKPAQGEAGDQTVKATVASNGTTDIRLGTITISTTDGKKVSVSVSQSALGSFGISKTKIKDVPAEGDEITVLVMTNVDCTAQSKVDWIEVVPPTKAVPEVSFLLKVAPNKLVEAREGVVEFSAEGFDPIPVTVSQVAFEPVITITGPNVMPKEGGEIRLQVESNVEWTCSADEVEDVYIDVEADGDEVVLTMDPNEGLESINFSVYVAAVDYDGIEATHAIRQDGIADIKYNVGIIEWGFDPGPGSSQRPLRLAYDGKDLIVSSSDYVFLVNAETGEKVRELDLGDVPHMSVTNDDAGNIVFFGQYAQGEEAGMFAAKSATETPELIASMPQSLAGNMSNFRVRGDIYGKAVVSAVVASQPTADSYVVLIQIEGGSISGTPVAEKLPFIGMWSPYFGCCYPLGDSVSDGAFYSGYNAKVPTTVFDEPSWFDYDLYYTADAKTYDIVFKTYNIGNDMSNAMDIAKVGDKVYMGFIYDCFFKWSNPGISIFDVTDPTKPVEILKLLAPLQRIVSDEYTNGYASGDIILVPGADGKSLEVYFAEMGRDSLAKIVIPL